MRIQDMNWMQVEAYLQQDDRAILPLGCTEQHAYISLSTDSILAERVSLDASAPLGIPVFPVLAYGITPYFTQYPGSLSLRQDTYLRIIKDLLDSMAGQGFKRILIVNGHGGNSPASAYLNEWVIEHPTVRVKFHNWWSAPKTMSKVREIDPVASHASWMENFPWTRLADVTMPDIQKSMVDGDYMRQLNPTETRDYLGDGNFGGYYQRDDAEMLAIWEIAVQETRALLEHGWA